MLSVLYMFFLHTVQDYVTYVNCTYDITGMFKLIVPFLCDIIHDALQQ